MLFVYLKKINATKLLIINQYLLLMILGLVLYKYFMINPILFLDSIGMEILASTQAVCVTSLLMGMSIPDLSISKVIIFNVLVYLAFPFVDRQTFVHFNWATGPTVLEYLWSYFIAYYFQMFSPITIFIGITISQIAKGALNVFVVRKKPDL